tara:strand:+ start:1083 stop:1904 length:822 start_codon:yes stop_codon:yes gene_type:complete
MLKNRIFNKYALLGLTLGLLPVTADAVVDSQKPLIVIGASYASAKTPYTGASAPLGGTAVNGSAYLSLGDALVREKSLPGFVVNEGQAGATSFARQDCNATTCQSPGWDSYLTMFNKALPRVLAPPTFSSFGAKYVVITIPNDCLHAGAFDQPQSLTTPCTLQQIDESIDRMIAVGQSVISMGLTPVFDNYPKYNDLDLNHFKNTFGLPWVIDQTSYNKLRNRYKNRIQSELPNAIQVDVWKNFTHIGDGIHPNVETAKKAAKLLANALIARD